MLDSMDMSTPMTRGEFAQFFEQFEVRFEQRLAQLATKAEIAQLATKAEIAQLATKAEIAQLATKAEIAQLATKAEIAQLATKAEIAQLATKTELEMWGGALLARIQSGEHMLVRLLERIELSEQRLLGELARHTSASHEDMSTQISVIDEKYADLPPRVSRLESKLFPTKRHR